MPSNEQRRDAAKRKLERQLERRAQRARKRKQMTIAGSAIGAVVVVGVVALIVVLNQGGDNASTAAASTTTPAEPTGAPLPTARAHALPATVDCKYPAGGGPAAKPVSAPPATGVPTTGTVQISLDTSDGPIGMDLDRAESPCTVNSIVSLAQQGYFNDTPCHRLTTNGIYVLQCGDPTGKGTGGPGYGFDNEFPTDQFPADAPQLQQPANYKRGTIAMANTGAPGSNGSQFFLVYKDSPLPPNYTVFGTIDEQGLKTIDAIAAKGDTGSNGPGDGAPKEPVQIKTAAVKA